MKKPFISLLTATLSIAFSIHAKDSADVGTTILEQSSQAFTHIADKAMPATVFIKVQIAQNTHEYPNSFEMFGDDFFQKFFGPQFQNPQQQPQMAGGSGFLISEDGYIVTNHHVIKDASQITVILNDDREYIATIKGADPRTDLALLKIEEKNLPHLSFGDSDKLKVGEWVVATGNPFGLEATLTVGVVSAKGRQDVGIASYEDFIQTDAAINPGNSGGPLLNLQAEVIGVNTAIFSRSGGYMGIGLSIPSKMAEHVIDQLMHGGSVKRAYLGVVLQPVDKELAAALSLDKQEGILISEVMKDSPAAKAGIESGDIIIQYNDKTIKNVNKFRNEIGMMKPESTIKLRILRNNKPLTIAVTLGAQTDGEALSTEAIQKIGLQIENLTPEICAKIGLPSEAEGVYISKVKPNSPAALSGIRSSFVITGVATSQNTQKRIRNISDFEEALKEIGDRKHIILIVRHQNFQRYYTIKIN
jgi:serine protease Do